MYLLMSEKDWLSVWGGGELCSPLLVKLEQAFSHLLYITLSQCRILLYSSSNVCMYGIAKKNAIFAYNFIVHKCMDREILIGFPYELIFKNSCMYNYEQNIFLVLAEVFSHLRFLPQK